MLPGVIDAGNNGQTEDDGNIPGGQGGQAMLPGISLGVGLGSKPFRVGQLEIQQKQVCNRQKRFQDLGRYVAVGLQCRVNTQRFGSGQKFPEKITLKSGFSAGNGKAAAGGLVIGPVPKDDIQNFRHGHFPAHNGKRMTGTAGGTAAAGETFQKIDMVYPIRQRMNAVGADFQALPAADAVPGGVFQLRLTNKRLRIVTPGTAKIAALEKNRRADSGAIVVAAALNIKNDSHKPGRPPL